MSDRFSSVQSLSCVQLFATPWTAAHQASLAITNSWSLLKFMSFHSVTSSNHLILCHLLLLLPSTFPSIRVFSISCSYQVAIVLELQLQHQSFHWILRTDFLWDGLVGSPCSPRDSQESSPTPQFKSINSLALSFLYGPTLLLNGNELYVSSKCHWTADSKLSSSVCLLPSSDSWSCPLPSE